MNLTEMTAGQLDQHIKDLGMIWRAVVHINTALKVECVAALSPGREAVIRTGWTMPAATEFGAPPPFVIEPSAAPIQSLPEEIAPAVIAAEGAEKPGGSGGLQQLDNVERPPADPQQREQSEALEGAACEPQVGAMPADSISGANAGPILGRMGDAEKAAIREMAANGMTLEQIVAATNRRVQSVASVLHNSKKKPTGQPVQAGDTTPAPAASTSSPVVAMDAKPETPAAGAEVPSADTGEPAREREAGVTAPKAGGAAPDFSFDQRRINAWLGGLGYRRGWNAQRDCDLVDALGRGLKFAEACADLGYDPRDAKVRWDELTRPICPDGRSVRLSGQADLLVVLRHRAGEA